MKLQHAIRGQFAFQATWIVLFLAALASSSVWHAATRLFPFTIAAVGLLAVLVQLVRDVFRVRATGALGSSDILDLAGIDTSERTVKRRLWQFVGWLMLLLVIMRILGLLIAVPIFVPAYLKVMSDRRWPFIAFYTAGFWSMLIGLFHYALRLPWPRGLVEGPQAALIRFLG